MLREEKKTTTKKTGVFVNSEAYRDVSCKLAGDWLVGLTLQLQSKQLKQANIRSL